MTNPPTTRERLALGQSHRKHLRRADLAQWQSKSRHAEPLKLLADSTRSRVPALASLKFDRMAASPFGFFRGAVPVMAYDLSLAPNTGIHSQLCGDAHVRNLGAFAGPDGRLIFDINDFDETIRGPFEFDVKRMATSLILAGRESGAKNANCREAALAFLAQYRTQMFAFTRMAVLAVARYEVRRLRALRPIAQVLRLAERATPLHTLEALTTPTSPSKKTHAKNPGAPPSPTAPSSVRVGSSTELARPKSPTTRIFKSAPPNLTRVPPETARKVLDSLATYAESLLPERRHFLAQYTPIDVAFKVVGTGSVGLRDYCIYLQGNGPRDPLFLQVKEETASAYAPYLGEPAAPHHHGQRAVEGQRAMQLQSDPFLGWTTLEGRDFLVRQLNDHKASVDMTALKADGLIEYANVCGEMLARGHARSGDAATIAGYIGPSDRFDTAIADFALAYANQTDRDWQTLVNSRRHAKPAAAPKTVVKSKFKPKTTAGAKGK